MSLLSNTRKKFTNISVVLLVTTVALSALSGCTTTPEFKPTASVLVGAHKSL